MNLAAPHLASSDHLTPGNVKLSKGEANLPEQSVVVVSHALAIDKLELRERIGTISKSRIDEIVVGIKLLIEAREVEVETE